MKECLYIKERSFAEKTLKSKFSNFTPKVKSYLNAYILPAIKENQSKKNIYSGGVCDENYNFIAGCFVERRFSCVYPYKPATEIMKKDETVIYGGMFFDHFGVMLVRSFMRLWWIVKNNADNCKIVFLVEPDNENPKRFCREFMAMLRIPENKYEIAEKPTLYSKVIVPDETYIFNESISAEFLTPFKLIRENLLKEYREKTPEKVYFSRSKFGKRNDETDGTNEEFYEEFFKKRGFAIFYPEQMPLERQIRIIAGAKEFVSAWGTLGHFGTLFLSGGAKQLMLLKEPDETKWTVLQYNLLELSGIDWTVVDATKNSLPTHHDGGVFFYYPTEMFKKYLDDNNIAYDENELKPEITADMIADYYKKWVLVYSNPEGFKKFADPEFFPILQSLYLSATGKLLNPKDYLE